uniref:Uncharacterized protein n=1 Tax=viral metagenome TaxID=1070528 RepID=A0A6C0FB87_9ZZZZ
MNIIKVQIIDITSYKNNKQRCFDIFIIAKQISYTLKILKKTDNVSEWLRRRPAKALCFARAGSNPAVVAQ